MEKDLISAILSFCNKYFMHENFLKIDIHKYMCIFYVGIEPIYERSTTYFMFGENASERI